MPITIHSLPLANGRRIYYDVSGTGSPSLVFIHAGLSKRTQWHNQIRTLSSRYTTVALDLAGHGDSEPGTGPWTIRSFGEDVASVVRHQDLEKVVLIGHSMGGSVMLEAAVLLPENVIGLIGIDTLQRAGLATVRASDETEAFLQPLRENWAAAVERETRIRFHPESDPAVLDQVLADMAEMRPDVGLAEMEDLFSADRDRRTAEVIAQIDVPIAIIAPDWRPFDTDAAQTLGITVELVPGTGHWIQMEMPDTVNAFIERKVAAFEASTGGK